MIDWYEVVMSAGQKCLTRVRSGRVSNLRIWKISPSKYQNFQFFPSVQIKSHWVGSKNTQVEDGSACYLLQVKSMLRLGQVRASSIKN